MITVRSSVIALVAMQLALAGCSTQQIARFETNVATNQCAKHGNSAYCAMSVNRGVEAYNAGRYDEAASLWNEPARRGNPAAQHNLGLLWRDGLGSTSKDLNQAAYWFLQAAKQGLPLAMVDLAKVQLGLNQPDPALSWLNMAARWNDPAAISMLRSMGAPVPSADLYLATQQAALVRQRQQAQVQAQAGYAIGCIIAGGCSQKSVQSPPIRSPVGSTSARIKPLSVGSESRFSSDQQTEVSTVRLCPDGSYVSGPQCYMAADGTYHGATPQLAPDGTYVAGRPQLAPNGRYVGGRGNIILCPDGTYVTGSTCILVPNGRYVGR